MERSVGLVVHRTRPEALAFAIEVIGWLESRGIKTLLDPETALKLDRPTLTCSPEGWQSVAFIVTLGGDGTILTASRMASPCGTPILGVHMGRFGFIAETHPDDLYPHLEEILDGKMQIEERIMLRADILRDGRTLHTGVGLNDVLVKSGMSHMLHLKIEFGGATFASYPADGILVSTPTGSTAYALSAGGPLVVPTVQALLVVPICPHTLSARPMIVPATETIAIEIETETEDVICAIDGVEPLPLQCGDRIEVRRAEYVTRLIVLDHATFYGKVRARYLYGERLNE
jgi:NAD+ kinase